VAVGAVGGGAIGGVDGGAVGAVAGVAVGGVGGVGGVVGVVGVVGGAVGGVGDDACRGPALPRVVVPGVVVVVAFICIVSLRARPTQEPCRPASSSTSHPDADDTA
jgi:hypothetical protein